MKTLVGTLLLLALLARVMVPIARSINAHAQLLSEAGAATSTR